MRARQVHAEYLSKARAQDRAFGLAQLAPGSSSSGPNSTIGPIERQLNSVVPACAAAVGGFGEGSELREGPATASSASSSAPLRSARKAAVTAHVPCAARPGDLLST